MILCVIFHISLINKHLIFQEFDLLKGQLSGSKFSERCGGICISTYFISRVYY